MNIEEVRKEQVLLGAVGIIKRHCDNTKCPDCMFFDGSIGAQFICKFIAIPLSWEIESAPGKGGTKEQQ